MLAMAKRRLLAAALLGVAVLTLLSAAETGVADAGVVTLIGCVGQDAGLSLEAGGGPVWIGRGNGGFSTANECARAGSLQIDASKPVSGTGENAQWQTNPPHDIVIVHATVPTSDVLVDPNSADGYRSHFYWAGGVQAIATQGSCCGGMAYGSGIDRDVPRSHYFGWQATCTQSTCSAHQVLDVKNITLTGVDTTPPALLALDSNNIWYQSGKWIRGSGWPASFRAAADDGVCDMREVVNGISIQGPLQWIRNPHSWTQCPTPETMDQTVDTTQLPNGPLTLQLFASDAANAANVSAPVETLHVDNAPVGLSLSGPADAPSTAGPQYVAAAATAGPSGVRGIFCSVDGGAYGGYAGPSAQIRVSGAGQHTISCLAENSAVDPEGRLGRSPVETFRMSIRQPTASAVSFVRIANALRCHRKTVTIRVRGRAHTKRRRVTVCHARTVLRRVMVVVRRHGKAVKVVRLRRVVLLPRSVRTSTLRVAHGRGTTVGGYLELTDGTALGGRRVEVLSAPDNGLEQFTRMATTTTAANGTWSVRVPPGPSRLIEALYLGDGTTEPSISAPVRLVVPAKISISIAPHVVPWSGQITIRGRLVGGYVPADGVALRLLVRYPGMSRPTALVPMRTNAAGGYDVTWSYHSGRGVATYPIWVATTAAESDYPFAAAASRKISVTFGRRMSRR